MEEIVLMKSNMLGRVVLCAAALALALGSFASLAVAQDPSYNGGQATQQGPKPKFVTLPPHDVPGVKLPSAPTTIPTWSGSFMSGTQTFNFKMVGADPSASNTTTSIPVVIIPIKIICAGQTFDPSTVVFSGHSATQLTVASPIFQNLTYTQGGTTVGTTQYEDAFQRGNFWTDVLTNTNYHTLLSPVHLVAEQTLSVPSSQCSIGNPFGFGNVALVSINYFDQQLITMIAALHQINSSAIAMGITYNTYLSENNGISGCCIGGYHSVTGGSPQVYGMFTYIPFANQFSQDVSALSHELGEIYDDPFINNSTEVQGNCSGILEVGDPLETEVNFGSFPYVLHGFTFHLQDLCFLSYWSGNTSLQVNGWYTFQDTKHSKCS
jgi:hypothetical protein